MRPLSFILVILVSGCMHPEFESTVSIEHLRVQAEQHHKAKEFDRAIELYEELGLATQLSLQDNYRLGVAYYFTRQYEKADITFGKIQARAPNASVPILWRARVNAMIDSTAMNGLAIQYYQLITESSFIQSPDSKAHLGEAYQYLGYYYFQKGDYDQVKLYLSKMIELYSDDDRKVQGLKMALKHAEERAQTK